MLCEKLIHGFIKLHCCYLTECTRLVLGLILFFSHLMLFIFFIKINFTCQLTCTASLISSSHFIWAYVQYMCLLSICAWLLIFLIADIYKDCLNNYFWALRMSNFKYSSGFISHILLGHSLFCSVKLNSCKHRNKVKTSFPPQKKPLLPIFVLCFS